MSRALSDAAMWARKGVKLALLVPASVGQGASAATPGLYVLIYHRVGAGMAAEMDVSEDLFGRQMAYVQDRFEVVALGQGLEDLASGKQPAGRDRVAVTFDDGYVDVFATAWPILERMQIPSTVFVATAFLDGQAPAPLSRDIPTRVPSSPLSWDQLATMAVGGLTAVGSHSHTHPNFDTLTPEQAERELITATAIIRERTGTDPAIFAYPRGRIAHAEVVARHHRFALGTDGEKNLAATFRPQAISRTPARRSDGMFFFQRRLQGMRPLEDHLYAAIKRTIR